MYVLTDYIGTLAAITTTIASIPQVYQIYKTNITEGLSLMYFIFLSSGIFLWLIYGIMIENNQIIYANLGTFLLLSYIVFKVYKNKKLLKNHFK